MSSTMDNLKSAFAGESQANQKYRAFAKKAEQEGFANVAKLFRTAAEAERIHAEGHLKSMEGDWFDGGQSASRHQRGDLRIPGHVSAHARTGQGR